MVYYSGHGKIVNATQRITLHDDNGFPLETKIRRFKNEHSKNSFAWAIFDSCRVAPDENESEKVMGEEQEECTEVN